MVWHEGYHHGQIKLALKLAGYPFDDEEIGQVTWDVWLRKTSGPERGRACVDTPGEAAHSPGFPGGNGGSRSGAVRRASSGHALRDAAAPPRAGASRRRRARARRRRQPGRLRRDPRRALAAPAAPQSGSARRDLLARHRERPRAPDRTTRLLRLRAPRLVALARRRLLPARLHADRRRSGGAGERRPRQFRHFRRVRRAADPRAWIRAGRGTGGRGAGGGHQPRAVDAAVSGQSGRGRTGDRAERPDLHAGRRVARRVSLAGDVAADARSLGSARARSERRPARCAHAAGDRAAPPGRLGRSGPRRAHGACRRPRGRAPRHERGHRRDPSRACSRR